MLLMTKPIVFIQVLIKIVGAYVLSGGPLKKRLKN